MSHTPERTCVGCRAKRPKSELVRVVRVPDPSGARIDARQRLPGRGAYLCPDRRCWDAGIRRGLERALRTRLSSPARQELIQALTEVK